MGTVCGSLDNGGRIDFPHDRLQSQTNYLNEHGDITVEGYNNQLFCFNPSTKDWQNVKSSGDVPSPRHEPSTATIEDKSMGVW